MTEKRTCRKCKDDLPIDDFPIVKGYHSWRCRSCAAVYSQAWAEAKKNRFFNSLVRWPANGY